MRAMVAGSLLLLSVPLQAARFTVSFDGKPLDGTEICVYPASGSNPLGRWFPAAPVQCHEAGEEIPLAAGDWNVVARRGSEYVSEGAQLITSDGSRGGSHELRVVRAARVTAAEPLFAYLPRTRSTMPLGGGWGIPADTTVIPVSVPLGRVVAVGAPVRGAPGESLAIESPAPRSGRMDVVVPFAFRALPEGKVDPPEVVATDSARRRHTPVESLRPEEGATGLLFFRGLPAGAAKIALHGTRWKSAEATAAVGEGEHVALPDKPLLALASSKLRVHWWTRAPLSILRPLEAECDAPRDPLAGPPPAETESFTAKLLYCPDLEGRGALNFSRCTEVDTRELAADAVKGTVEFEDVGAGLHFVHFTAPRLPVIFARAPVAPRETTDLDAELRYFSFFGEVTRGGKPVHTRLFSTVSDPVTGRYVAVVTRAPQGTQVLAACDGSMTYRFVLDEPPAENAAFDIEIPDNRVVVEVTDQATGLPIERAIVSIAAMRDPKAGAAHFAMQHGRTDEQGRATIEPVLTNTTVRICAGHEEYAGRCADDFTMGETREKTLQIALEKVVKRQGRVVAGRPFTRGQLVWFSPDGAITEMIRKFEPDGSFTYTKERASGEIGVFTSADTPLYVFMQPYVREDDVLTIRVPAAPSRSFTVRLAETARQRMTVALKVGEIPVPVNALAWHLGPRHRVVNVNLAPGQSLHVIDILEPAPISIVLIPPPVTPPPPGPPRDPMFRPDRNAWPAQLLGDRELVVFD